MPTTPRLDDVAGVHDALARRAAATPDRTAFTFLDADLSELDRIDYGDLHRRAGAVAAALRAALPSRAHVLLLLPPGIDYIAAVFGCFYAGMVAVSALPPTSERIDRVLPRLRSIVEDTADGIVATSDIRAGIDGLGGLDEVTWLDMDAIRDVPGDVPAGAAAPDDLAFLQYTSGSTARPRGVMLTHRNLLVNCRAISAAFGTSGNTVEFSWLPPYHDMGLIGGILHPILIGAPCHLTSPVTVIRRPLRWLEAMTRLRATFSGGPNFMYDLCVRRSKPEDIAALDLSEWRVAVNGAEPVKAATLEAFADTFAPAGFRPDALTPAYGLAEATLLLTTSGEDAPTIERFDAAALREGRAVSGEGIAVVGCGSADADHQVVVVDPDTRVPCEDGVVGEVWARGPSIAQGYWRLPEDTEQVFGGRLRDDPGQAFMRTGDLGFWRHGTLFITGRRKEILIINGVTYHPHDIEMLAESDDARLRPHASAAFTVENADAVGLALVMEVARGEHAPDDLVAAVGDVRRRVAAGTGLSVGSVTLVPPRAVPKTTSGKIQRLLSRDLLLSGRFTIVHEWHADGWRPARGELS